MQYTHRSPPMAPPQPPQPRAAAPADDIEALTYVNSLVEAFRAFDSDSDGLITGEELKGIMSSLGYNPSEQEASEMMRRGDADGDGLLSMEEFLELNTAELQLGDLSGVLQAAAATLGPADGEVTAEELYQVLSGCMGGAASMEECMDIIACLDADGDGAVSVESLQIIAQALL